MLIDTQTYLGRRYDTFLGREHRSTDRLQAPPPMKNRLVNIDQAIGAAEAAGVAAIARNVSIGSRETRVASAIRATLAHVGLVNGYDVYDEPAEHLTNRVRGPDEAIQIR